MKEGARVDNIRGAGPRVDDIPSGHMLAGASVKVGDRVGIKELFAYQETVGNGDYATTIAAWWPVTGCRRIGLS